MDEGRQEIVKYIGPRTPEEDQKENAVIERHSWFNSYLVRRYAEHAELENNKVSKKENEATHYDPYDYSYHSADKIGGNLGSKNYEEKPIHKGDKVGSQTYTSATGGGASYSTTGYTYTQQKPAFAFKHDGIEFWGSARTYLEDASMALGSQDLVVNCSGTEMIRKPFIKKSPAWFKVTESIAAPVAQILFDWNDM